MKEQQNSVFPQSIWLIEREIYNKTGTLRLWKKCLRTKKYPWHLSAVKSKAKKELKDWLKSMEENVKNDSEYLKKLRKELKLLRKFEEKWDKVTFSK